MRRFYHGSPPARSRRIHAVAALVAVFLAVVLVRTTLAFAQGHGAEDATEPPPAPAASAPAQPSAAPPAAPSAAPPASVRIAPSASAGAAASAAAARAPASGEVRVHENVVDTLRAARAGRSAQE